jgi:hypothetical protein
MPGDRLAVSVRPLPHPVHPYPLAVPWGKLWLPERYIATVSTRRRRMVLIDKENNIVCAVADAEAHGLDRRNFTVARRFQREPQLAVEIDASSGEPRVEAIRALTADGLRKQQLVDLRLETIVRTATALVASPDPNFTPGEISQDDFDGRVSHYSARHGRRRSTKLLTVGELEELAEVAWAAVRNSQSWWQAVGNYHGVTREQVRRIADRAEDIGIAWPPRRERTR